MKELTEFLERICEEDRDLVKAQLAKFCELSVYTIESYRRGTRKPKKRTINKLKQFIENFNRKEQAQ